MLEASPSFHCGGTFGHDAIDLEHRQAAGLRLRRLSRALGSENQCHWQTSSDDTHQHCNETESLALHGFLLCEMK